jgi:hypothetical protein
VRFGPTAEQPYSGNLVIISNARISPTMVLVSGIGVSPLALERITSTIPEKFFLDQYFPNPFNPETTIKYTLASAAQAKLSILNILGQELAVLAEGLTAAGEHKISWNAADFPSGIYFAKLQSLDRSDVRKLVLLK